MENIFLSIKKVSALSLLTFLILTLCASCVSQEKLTYLQTDKSLDSLTFQLERTDYRLQVNDIVNIDIRSLNSDANDLFNSTAANQMMNLNAGDIIFYLQGYSVDNQGNILHSEIGFNKEKAKILDEQLNEYLTGN